MELLHKLPHAATPEHVSWNHDDSVLLTCCADDTAIYMWDVSAGCLVHSFQKHTKVYPLLGLGLLGWVQVRVKVKVKVKVKVRVRVKVRGEGEG